MGNKGWWGAQTDKQKDKPTDRKKGRISLFIVFTNIKKIIFSLYVTLGFIGIFKASLCV